MRATWKLAQFTGMLLLVCLSTLGADQEDSQVPGTNNAKTLQLKGSVESISMAKGMGPATVTLRTSQGAKYTIRLGPVRFLLQKDFNLTAGDPIEVRAVTVGVPTINLAVEVKNLGNQKTIRLRDDDLHPLWARGRRHRVAAR